MRSIEQLASIGVVQERAFAGREEGDAAFFVCAEVADGVNQVLAVKADKLSVWHDEIRVMV